MALNHARYKAMKWLRSLMTEMGLGHSFDEPSIYYSCSNSLQK
jgi:hypothetical protein